MEKRSVNHVRIPDHFVLDLIFDECEDSSRIAPFAFAGKEVTDAIETRTASIVRCSAGMASIDPTALASPDEQSDSSPVAEQALVSTRGLPHAIAAAAHRRPSVAKRIQQLRSQGNNIEYAGWLVKQGGVVASWKKRWFRLAGGVLQYFKTDAPGEQPLGTIPLAECTDLRECSDLETKVARYTAWQCGKQNSRVRITAGPTSLFLVAKAWPHVLPAGEWLSHCTLQLNSSCVWRRQASHRYCLNGCCTCHSHVRRWLSERLQRVARCQQRI